MEAFNRVYGTDGIMERAEGYKLLSYGEALSENAELVSVINNHTYNIRGLTLGFKLRTFGGGIGNNIHLFSAYVHDPLRGYVTVYHLDSIGILPY